MLFSPVILSTFAALSSARLIPSPSTSHTEIDVVAGSTPPNLTVHFSVPCRHCISDGDDIVFDITIPATHSPCGSTHDEISVNGIQLSRDNATPAGNSIGHQRLDFTAPTTQQVTSLDAVWLQICRPDQTSALTLTVIPVDQNENRDSQPYSFTLSYNHGPFPEVIGVLSKAFSEKGPAETIYEWNERSIEDRIDFSIQSSRSRLEIEYAKLEIIKQQIIQLGHEFHRQEGAILSVINEDFKRCTGFTCYLQTAFSKVPDFFELAKSHFKFKPVDTNSTVWKCLHGAGEKHSPPVVAVPYPGEAPEPNASRIMSRTVAASPTQMYTASPITIVPTSAAAAITETSASKVAINTLSRSLTVPTSSASSPDPPSKSSTSENPPPPNSDSPHPPPHFGPTGFDHPPFDGEHHGPPPWAFHGHHPPHGPDDHPPHKPHHDDDKHNRHPRPKLLHPAPRHRHYKLIFALAGAISSTLIVLAFLKLLLHYCMNPRVRADRMAHIEERRNRRAYKRAARQYRFRQMLGRFSGWGGRERGTADYEEKRAILRRRGSRQDDNQDDNVIRADINSLRRAHEIVSELMRAEEGRAGSAGEISTSQVQQVPPSPQLFAHELPTGARSDYGSMSTLPPYVPPPPRYSSELSRDTEVVDGFRYTPSHAAATASSSTSSFILDDESEGEESVAVPPTECESSVVDCRSRMSLETTFTNTSERRNRKSFELAGDRYGRDFS